MANKTIFNPVFIDQTKPVSSRQIIQQLPEVHQTDTLKRFFNASINHLFNPGQGQQINGYIGEMPSWYNPGQDFYISEPTTSRQFYQLEPCMVSKNTDGAITNLLFYPDIINQLRFQGAITSNHDRLFEQDYYSWCPPINLDMLLNFREYYWVENDDLQPDYLVIQTNCIDGNPWSVNNLWVHEDDLTSDQLSNATQARRPIIEIQRNIELFNYGNIRRSPITAVADSIDFLGLIATTNSENLNNITIDGFQITQTTSNVRILVINDKTSTIDNQIFSLSFNIAGIVVISLATDGVDITGNASLGEITYVDEGTVYGNKEVYFDGTTWIVAQTKTDINVAPLFNLYDTNNILLNDPTTYPSSNFNGNKLFSYNVATSGNDDLVLGFPLSFDSNGQIYFQNFIASQIYTYDNSNVTDNILGFYYHKIIGDIPVYGNDWYPVSDTSRQMIVDQYTCDGINQIFQVSQSPDVGSNNLIVTRTYQSNTAVSDYISITLVEGTDYLRLDGAIVLNTSSNGDILEIKSYGSTGIYTNATGFYEVAPNLSKNPNNTQVTQISSGDCYQQFSEILSNQIGFIGDAFSDNNWRNTSQDRSLGTEIVQHTANLLNLSLSLSESQLDFMNSARYVETEYIRFRNRFEQKISSYLQNGKSTTDTTTSTWINQWINDALKDLAVGKTQTFPFAYSNVAVNSTNTIQNFIPSTPSFIGAYPLYTPEMIIDLTFELEFIDQIAYPQMMICNHDGSLTPTYGKYQLNADGSITSYQGIVDPRDQVILALETRIFDSVNLNIASQERPLYDYHVYYSNYWRTSSYSYAEFISLLQPAFDRWTSQFGIDSRTNSTFVQDDPFTWNWSQVPGLDGNFLPGYWRGIALYYYDTDRPHTNPWEMLGFANKPSYWDSRYGMAPYTSNNLTMWQDIENGYIFSGPRSGINQDWARPNLSKIIPVDEEGNLLDPVQMGIAQYYPPTNFANQDWVFGDCSPVETAWRRTSLFPFAITEAGYLMKPARFFGTLWDSGNYKLVNGQYIDASTYDRPRHSELQVHGETDSSGNVIIKYGIQQWISDYVLSLNQNVTISFGDLIRGLDVQLAYKMAGFTDSNSLSFTSDSFDLVPSENTQVQLYQSPSIREEFYSGVIINFDGSVFKVYGYDILNPAFIVIPPNVYGPSSSISYATSSEVAVPNWKPNTRYTVGVTVNHVGIYYTCITTYTSSQIFESNYWKLISTPTFASKLSVSWYSSSINNDTTSIPYGTVLNSLQEVANFFNGLERYYVAQGWIFDQVINNGSIVSNWSRSCLEFLSWFKDNQTQSNVFLALSPASGQITFETTQGEPQSVEQFINGTYSLIDRQSKPIKPNDVDIARSDGQIIVTPNSDVIGGIFGCRLYICEIEHVVIFDNETIFNDTIYDPLLNIRQPRLRLQGFKTTNWLGRINAPGFIVTGNVLTPNFEKSADNFRHFFDIETVDDDTLQERARNNAGYYERDYLTNLLLTPTNQFEFYQGMIQQKGTPAVMNRLLRSNFIRNNTDIEFLEEWAFRVGDYGSSQVNPSFDLQLKQSDVTTDPQLIVFTVAPTAPLAATNVIQITDITDSSTGLITSRDSHWIWRQNFAQVNWSIEQFKQNNKGFLPNTGYVDINEVTWFAETRDDLILLYNSTLSDNPSNSMILSYTFSYDGISTNPANVNVPLIPNLTNGYLRIDEIQINVTESFIENSLSISIGRFSNPIEFANISSDILSLGQNTIYLPFAYFELNTSENNTVYVEFNYLGLAPLGANIGEVTVTIKAEQFTNSILPNQRALVYNDTVNGWNTYKLQDTGIVVTTAYIPSFSGQGTPLVLQSSNSILGKNDLLIIDGVSSTSDTTNVNMFTSVYNPVFQNINRTVISPTVLAAAVVNSNGYSEIPLMQMLNSAGMVIDTITVNVVQPFTGGTIAPKLLIGTSTNNSLYVSGYTPLDQFVPNNPQLSGTPSFASGNPVSIDIYDTIASVSEGTNYVPVQIVRSGNIYYTLNGITVTSSGSSYTSAPLVTVSDPPGVQAVASLAGYVNQILIVNGGTGYTSIPVVTITGGNGNGATARATISGGQVTSIIIVTAGGAYTTEPTVIISGGNGTGANAVATVNYGVASITVTTSGNCLYDGSSIPTVTITGGGGSGAAATAQLTNTLPPMTVNWRYQQTAPNVTNWIEGSPVTFPPIGTLITNPITTPVAGGSTSSSTTGYWLQTIYVPVSNPEISDSTYQVQIYDPITDDTNYQIGQEYSDITVVKTQLDNNSIDLTVYGTTVVTGSEVSSNDILTAYIAANSNTGTVIINVNYHYTEGFEVFNLDGTPNVITSVGQGGRILGWYKTRFANLSMLNSATVPNGWSNLDVAEVDYVPTILTNGGWATYQYNDSTNIWNQIRTENLKVDSRQFVNATIYNSRTNEILQSLQIFDPYQGLIIGTADRELTYKVSYDPAIYNASSDSSIPTNTQNNWGPNQLNQLWWDLSTVRYIDYNIDGSAYKWKNWGDLAPNITIDVYEWIRSPVPPTQWNSYVSSSLSTYVGFSTTPTSGSVNDTNVYGWVEVQEWIPALNRDTTAYYFWVKNVASLPQNSSRQITALQVASIIQDPVEQNIPWFAAIDSNQLIISGIQQYLDDTDTVLKLNWKLDKNEGNQHKQWKILRESDVTTNVDLSLWNKMRDSLVGWDDYQTTINASDTLSQPFSTTDTTIILNDASQFAQAGDVLLNGFYVSYTYKNGNILQGITNNIVSGSTGDSVTQTVSIQAPKIVPDPLLTPLEAHGNLIRPRQSWFVPESNGTANRYARQIFVESFNSLMQAQPYLDTWYQWQDVWYGTDNPPDSSLYNYQADNYADRDSLATSNVLQIGQTVFIPGNSETNNFWTIWLYTGNDSITQLPNFTLYSAQRYQMKNNSLLSEPGDFWTTVDWYLEGWSTSDFPLYHFDSYLDFLASASTINTTLLKGTLIMIDQQSPTDTRWSWQVYLNGQWTEVAKQNGTLALSSAFYDPTKVLYGFGTIEPSDLNNIPNRDGSWELKYLLNQIADLSLFTELQMNTLFFAMSRCALSLSQNIDWIIKTSFMTIGGYSEPLLQSPLAYASQIDNVISYIEEVKPYHVKIREYVVQYTVGPDIANTHVTDFDTGYATPDEANTNVIYLPSTSKQVNLAADFATAATLAQATATEQTAQQNAALSVAVAANRSANPISLTPFNDILNIDAASWNGLRHGKTTILFDRISCSEINSSGWDLFPWDYYTSEYVTNINPGNQQQGLRLATDYLNPITHIHFNENIEISVPSLWDTASSENAANRIAEYYAPTANMKQLDYANLINGCDYRGFIQDGGPLSLGLWDMFLWDFEGGWANEDAYYDGSVDTLSKINTNASSQPTGEMQPLLVDYKPGDVDIDGMSFTFSSYQLSNEFIDLDGGKFSDPYVQSGNPEELVSIIFISTLIINLSEKDHSGNVTNSQWYNQTMSDTWISSQ